MKQALIRLCLSSFILLGSSSAFSGNPFAQAFELGEFNFVETHQMKDENQQLNKQLVTTIISEPQGGLIHTLSAETEETGNLVHLVRETEKSDNKHIITMEELMDHPVVLAHASEKDILILSCEDCSVEEGGSANLSYLYNGMTMAYRNLKMNLEKDEASKHWTLFTEGKEITIESLRLIPRKVFGQVVGIKRIVINQ